MNFFFNGSVIGDIKVPATVHQKIKTHRDNITLKTENEGLGTYFTNTVKVDFIFFFN